MSPRTRAAALTVAALAQIGHTTDQVDATAESLAFLARHPRA